jgi:hypothetical protein
VKDSDWTRLIKRIHAGACTPFLGAGACHGTLPLGGDVAAEWAQTYKYPLRDRDNLARVAQFVGVMEDPMTPKELMRDLLGRLDPPDFTRPEEPHAALAKLPFPLFLTTNYDDFMTKALAAEGKDARQEVCRWNRSLAVLQEPSRLADDPTYAPTPKAPVVYHLHGRLGVPHSMVLTEDDYLDFLVAISRDAALLPHQIQRAVAETSLLFIGYGLADWNFRVIHRGLVTSGEGSLRRLSVTVQVDPNDAESVDTAREYLDSYFEAMDVRVFWGTAADFVAELSSRWRESGVVTS